MTSVPVAKCRIFNNKFKRLYLKNKKLFVDYWLHFWNVNEIGNVLENKKSILV